MLDRLIEFTTTHYVLTATFFAVLALVIVSETRRGGRSLGTRELTALVNSGKALLLDVRSHKEFSAGHIVDALNMPFDKLAERMVELERHKDKTIIVVDAMGQHSGGVTRQLKVAGYDAARLGGGIASWRGDNLPLVK
jgi:rhodanese-related sulfurtransferase